MNEMLKMFTIAIIVLAVCSAGAFASYTVGKYFDERHNNTLEDDNIESFEDCINAGTSAIVDNPLRCIDNEGNVFLK